MPIIRYLFRNLDYVHRDLLGHTMPQGYLSSYLTLADKISMPHPYMLPATQAKAVYLVWLSAFKLILTKIKLANELSSESIK